MKIKVRDVNVSSKRFIYNKRTQKTAESMTEFILELRVMVKNGDFEEPFKDALRALFL